MIGLLVFVSIRMTNTSRAGRYGNLVSCPTYCVGFLSRCKIGDWDRSPHR